MNPTGIERTLGVAVIGLGVMGRTHIRAYQAAAAEMLERTSTEIAPWTLVEAEDKLHARLKVLATVESALEGALRGRR